MELLFYFFYVTKPVENKVVSHAGNNVNRPVPRDAVGPVWFDSMPQQLNGLSNLKERSYERSSRFSQV